MGKSDTYNLLVNVPINTEMWDQKLLPTLELVHFYWQQLNTVGMLVLTENQILFQ